MKILYVTHYSELYGANRSLLDLIYIIKNNYDLDVLILIPRKNKELEDFLIRYNIKYYVIPFNTWFVTYKSKNSIRKLLSIIKGLIKIVLNYLLLKYNTKFLQKEKIDVVHTNSSATNFGALIAKKLKVQHFWHFREYGIEDYNLNFVLGIRKAMNFVNKSSNQVIFISKDLMSKYRQYLDQNKINIIYNGVFINSDNLVVNEAKVKTDKKFNIVITGVLNPFKGHIEAIEAINKLAKKDYNLVLNIIGDSINENYKKYLYKLIEQYNIFNFVKFWGYLQSPINFIKNCDLGIVCSRREAFGRVITEYMMLGLPVIASNSGGATEVIGDAGFLYNTGDPEELANKIEILINDSKKREDFRENGINRVNRLFRIEYTAEKVYNLYRKIN